MKAGFWVEFVPNPGSGWESLLCWSPLQLVYQGRPFLGRYDTLNSTDLNREPMIVQSQNCAEVQTGDPVSLLGYL